MKYDYKYIATIENDLVETLNRYGSQGWRVVWIKELRDSLSRLGVVLERPQKEGREMLNE